MAAAAKSNKVVHKYLAVTTQKILELADALPSGKLTSATCAYLHFQAFMSAFLRKEYLEGKPHYKKMLEFSRAVVHPDCLYMNYDTNEAVKRARERCPELDS